MFQDCVPVCWPMRGSGASRRGMSIAAECGLAGAAGTICTPGGATRRWIASSTFTTPPTFNSRPAIHPPRKTPRNYTTATLERIFPRIGRPSAPSCAPLRPSNPRVNSRSLSASPHSAMARSILPLAALVAIVPFASAGVTFTSPKAGTTLTAGTAIQAAWAESGDGPKLTDMTTYTLSLMAGGSKDGEFVSALHARWPLIYYTWEYGFCTMER
jgi:hypothetical protein